MPAAPPPCPLCGKPATAPFRPFCCRRCADVDLGRWLTGEYRVPATATEPEEDDPDAGSARLDRPPGMG
jgi:endogenous inhibitor of DNA gyrase (YacG/DUF329 family)